MPVHRVLHVWRFFWVLQFNKDASLKEGQGLNKGFVTRTRLVLPTDVSERLLWGLEGSKHSERWWDHGNTHDK